MAPHAEVGMGFSNGNGSLASTNKDLFVVNSPNVVYTENQINTKYTYRTTSVTTTEDGKFVATPKETVYDFKVDRKVPKTVCKITNPFANH
jgi:myo-inositol-1-phosphate synthase